jgi:arginine decarboxylase
MTPKMMFFTKGVGVHKDKLSSFEVALGNAGIAKCNLVYVSSIFPPKCKIITRSAGEKLLRPGQITYCVMARNETNEPNRLVSAAIGFAMPKELRLSLRTSRLWRKSHCLRRIRGRPGGHYACNDAGHPF